MPKDSWDETRLSNVYPGYSTYRGAYFLTVPPGSGFAQVCPISGDISFSTPVAQS